MFETIGNEIFEIKEIDTGNQKAKVRAFYDNVFHIKLTSDKQSILSDGIDKAVIIADVYNYLNEKQTTWKGDIVFILDGLEKIVSTTTGNASIELTASSVGEFIIETKVTSFRNASIKVVVV